ncbi:hypothetical protein HKD37_06G016970 [Glycine soja]
MGAHLGPPEDSSRRRGGVQEGRGSSPLGTSLSFEFAWKNCFREENLSRGASETLPSLGTDVWGANTFPVRKYNSRTFHLKVRRSRLFRFFRRFPQINVGGDSARIPFVEHASRESRVALPPKGRLRHEPSSRAFLFENLLLLVVPTATICSSKGMIPLETIKRDITTLGIIAKNLVISMGTNQTGERFYQVKVKSPDTTSIKELGRLMEPLQMQAFRKTYGKILELTIAEVSIEAIASLTQYYDQPLRCFTFGDFQLVPTIEEFEEILGCPLGGRKPYLSSGCLPSLSRIATVVKDSARGLDRIKQTRNDIAGLPQKYLEDKARGMANQGEWVPFMDVLALLIFGVVLFPNVDGLVGLAAIDAFLAYHHSKESPVIYLTHLTEGARRVAHGSSVAYPPSVFGWFHTCSNKTQDIHVRLLSHRSCTEKRRMDWDQLLAGIGSRTISWFPRWKEGKEGVLFSCGRYPNIPLVGTRGCINYNPALAIRQLGYPMRGAPTEESMSPFLVRDLGAQNSKTIQRIHKAWETPLRKDQELRGIRNGIIGGYHEWLKVRIRGLDWLAKLKVVGKENFEAPEEDEEVQALKSELGKAKLAKEKFKLAATHVRKECAGLREENAITARALERETKRARKEEYGRNKFRGALWGSNNELKLRREERDQSRAHSMVLKEELVACSRSKRSLSQRLCETETNMLAIIAKYQEELGLATAHEHRIADEYAQVYAEKEARGRVIDSLHQEATMWMDRFALTLNGSQELPRLLAKAKAMAGTYSAPEEIHGLLGYCQHMIDLMAHIIRNPDMSALKEQMASMMEAMLGMKQLMEKNAATAAAVSSAAEADPTLLATTHHPPSNIVGRGRDTLGHDGSPHLGYNRAAYPYGLPPNYSPPILQEDAGHIASPVHEKEPPQQPDEVHKDPQDYARRDVEFYPPIPEGPAPGTLPQPNIAASPIVFFADLVFAGERIEVGLKRGKFDYVSSTNVNAKRIGATGAKRKEGDAHAVSSTPAWVKPQQTPHGTHQYAQHHPSFSAHAGNASSSTPVQPKAPTQREAPQVPTPNTARPAGNSNTTRNFPPRPLPEFTPLPMTYEDLLPSLIANHLAVVTPGRVLEPPFPKWYDPNATCKYHGGAPGHSVEKCLALKYKVQHLMDAGWLTFQEDRPNVRTNPLANHGGGAVNGVESDRPHRSKPLRDVATPRRFIFEALQKGGVIPHSGCKEDSCLLHSGEMHDMETCLEVEELLQRMIDQGRLEVGIKGKEEQHICMQSTEGSGVAKPKPLVIYFTKSAASQKPGHPLMAKPVPFPYQNSHAVPWRYTPPGKKEEEVTDVSSLSAKVTNITGLSGVTRSGRVFAPPDLPVQPADVKGKGKVVEEQDGEAPHASNKDMSAKGPPEKRDGRKEVSLEEASEFLRIIQQSEFKVIEQLNKTPARVSLLELLMSSEPHRALLVKVLNEAHYGLGYKPTQADMKRSIAGRKNSGQSSRWRQESEGSPPCHISRSFISAGLGDEGQVFAICEDDVPSTSDLVRPCPPDFQLGNWRVEERPGIYATSIINERGFEAFSPHGQDHLGLPSGVETKHERQKPIKALKDERKRGWGHDRPIVALLCAKQAGNVAARQPRMAPRKLASKRSRKDKAAEGTSSAPEYDSHRFRSIVHQQRFEAIKGWSFLRERRDQLRDDEYTDFQEEIGRRRWAPLVTPMAKFDPEIVLEFYANAWPTEEGVRDMRSWVRGQWIPFDADAISQLLGYPMVLEEGQECEYGQRRNRSDGFDEEAIAQLLSTSCPPIIIPTSPCRSMAPTRHPLDPDKSNRALGFPALITGLCQSFGVPVAPTKVIRPPITRAFIEKYCTQRQAQGDAPQAAGAPPPPHQAGQAGAFDIEQYLRHLVRQQAANHRAHVRTHDCLYQMSLSMQSQGFASFSCPTPDQFRAEVAWPGDWPEAQAGEAPPEAPGDGEEAHEDEEMADLLDFLGGSGDTGENNETFSSLTSCPELRRSEFLMGGYVGARASLLSTTPPFVAMTQELVARGDTLRLSAPFLSSRGGGPDDKQRPKAAGPMTSRDQVWSFCTHDMRRYLMVIRTLLSSRGGGPDDKQRPKAAGPMTSRDQVWSFCTHDTRRYLMVIRTLLSSRGGGPDDKQRPKAAGPMTSRDQVWSFCTHDTRRYLTVIRTFLSSRGGGPDDKQRPKAAGPMTSRDQVWSFYTHDTRRYLMVIRTLLSSRGGGPDDKQRPKAAGPMTSRDQVWSFCTHDTRRYLTVIRTFLSSRGGGPDDKQRPKAAGPMTSRDQVWSFCTHDTRRYLTVIRTLVSSRGGGPDDTRRYLTVIRTLLSSRGGGPDDKQRPSLVILHPCIIQRRGPDDTRKYPSGYPKSKPRRFRNVSVTFSVRNLAKLSTVLRRSSFVLHRSSIFNGLPSLGTDVWGANTFPVRKYNSRTFHLKVRRSRLFRFFRRFPQINVGGDSARIPFVEHASRESRVALPPKGRLRQLLSNCE